MKNDLGLVGMFLIDDDGEGFRTGEIVAAVDSSHCLVQFDNMKESLPGAPPLMPLTLYAIEELSHGCGGCGQKNFSLFKSRADMNKWITWLDEPSPHKASDKVVHLKH
jgi:hypothetical protein